MKLDNVEKSTFPTSPVVVDGNVTLVDSIAVEDIVRLYRQQTGICVRVYFGDESHVRLFICDRTGYRFYHPFGTQGDSDFYESLYRSNLADGHDYDRAWSDDHEFALAQISPTDELLEIGCGTGKFLERAVAATATAGGLELSAFAAQKAAAKGLKVDVGDLAGYAERHAARFDSVCAFQVLEHESDVERFFRSAIRLLRPQGRLILSVPNCTPFYQRFNKYEVMNLPPHHVGLWHLDSLQRVGEFFDIRLIDHQYFANSRLLVDAYLRAKLWARVKSLPRQHSGIEKLQMLALAPFSVLRSGIDYAFGNVNRAYITVVYRKVN